MKKILTTLVLGAMLATSIAPSFAQAQEHRGWSRDRHGGPSYDYKNNNRWDRDHDRGRGNDRDRRGPPPVKKWSGWDKNRDIHRFKDRDFAAWREGQWWRGKHNNRDGWWWVVGNLFYPYANATSSYPDPYTPSVVIVSSRRAPPEALYYCKRPAGYYPYVQACAVPWKAVLR